MLDRSEQSAAAAAQKHKRLFFVANCTCSPLIGGGDIHFFHMAEGAIAGGFDVSFFGGHALQKHLEARGLAARVILTDQKPLAKVDMVHLKGQIILFFDYVGRFFRTLPLLKRIQPDDLAYAVTDYWFDAWPAAFSRARAKMLVLGMDSPTLREIALRTRPDVPATRVTSIYYWLSQNISLRLFRRCRNKKVFYVHPLMRPRLLRLGYAESELVFISNGLNLEVAASIPAQPRKYDVAWTGRVHRQKGVDDLLGALKHLAQKIPDFRAILIGRLQDQLGPRIEELGLTNQVEFSGFVSEEEKFRLLKSSRLFLMPSHYESWGIVIGEALGSDVPVVAYKLDAYPAIFGELVQYVPCFDQNRFQQVAADAVVALRKGKNLLAPDALDEFKKRNSWSTAQKIFCETARELAAQTGMGTG